MTGSKHTCLLCGGVLRPLKMRKDGGATCICADCKSLYKYRIANRNIMVIYKALTWIGGISLIGVPILASQVAHYPLIFAIELGALIGLSAGTKKRVLFADRRLAPALPALTPKSRTSLWIGFFFYLFEKPYGFSSNPLIG